MTHDLDPIAPDADEPLVQDTRIVRFWNLARSRAGVRLTEAIIGADWPAMIAPPAWAFGADAEQADRLLAQVLAGTKTATTSARSEYDDGARLPEEGEISILLDGEGAPGALIRVTHVDTVDLGDVDAEFAHLEGEATLEEWRAAHLGYFSQVTGAPEEQIGPDFPVVLERFEVLFP